MFKILFKIIINLMATIVQLVALPINLVITNAMPDISNKIVSVSTTINGLFSTMSWAFGLIPDVLVETLLFIITIEIAKHTIYIGTHALIKVWNLFQKVKFW